MASARSMKSQAVSSSPASKLLRASARKALTCFSRSRPETSATSAALTAGSDTPDEVQDEFRLAFVLTLFDSRPSIAQRNRSVEHRTVGLGVQIEAKIPDAFKLD